MGTHREMGRCRPASPHGIDSQGTLLRDVETQGGGEGVRLGQESGAGGQSWVAQSQDPGDQRKAMLSYL